MGEAALPSLTVLDSATRPGSPDRPNEDAFGTNSASAFVIDGATGLSDTRIMADAETDAAWLAKKAAHLFENALTCDTDIGSVVADCLTVVRTEFLSAQGPRTVERYAWPSASFAAVHVQREQTVFAGLGDCTVLTDAAETVSAFSPLADFASLESEWAATHLARAGGFARRKDILSDPETLADLRRLRSLQNSTESGVWTLGLEPAAADHLVTQTIAGRPPFHCLLCTDGFSALIDSYSAYGPETLLADAIETGLDRLLDKLRHIENTVDPDGERFPRFKRSDDATALLIRVE